MEFNDIIWINGEFYPAGQANISVRDRGFRFGDGIFEAIPFFQCVPFQWEWHLNRLMDGLDATGIPRPNEDFHAVCRELIYRSNLTDGILRLTISRGVGSAGYRPLPDILPTCVAECLPIRPQPEAMHLWLVKRTRPSPRALPTASKLCQGMNPTLAIMEAEAQGCDDALMLNEDGMLCETASANLFWLENGRCYTPPIESGCLNGATRHFVLSHSSIAIEEALHPPERLMQAEAVFTTNISRGVLPIASIQPTNIILPTQHPFIQGLSGSYKELIERSIKINAATWIVHR